VRSSNKERKKIANYFLLGMAATCVLESQVGFIYKVKNVRKPLSFLWNGEITWPFIGAVRAFSCHIRGFQTKGASQ